MVETTPRNGLEHRLLTGQKSDADGCLAGPIYNADNAKSYEVSLRDPTDLKARGCMFSMFCAISGQVVVCGGGILI